MAILSGRNGRVAWSDTGGSPATDIISLNTFHISMKTDFEEVSAFGDANKVYIPGLVDLSGTLGGFWNTASSLVLVAATKATSPGFLELEPNTTENGFIFSGQAYIDLDVDCSLSAPKVSGNFRAAGEWALPGSP